MNVTFFCCSQLKTWGKEMSKTQMYVPPWVQTDLQTRLIGDETVQTVVILAKYPLNLKKTYLAVTDKRLIGKEKTWLSSKLIDSPLRDITRVQVNTSLNLGKIIKTVFWGFLSLFLFILIIPVVLTILNFLSIGEKDLVWTVKGYGNEIIGGRRHALETIQTAIREVQLE